MTYSEALAQAVLRWGNSGVAWRSYDGLHFVGRSIGVAIEVMGEGATWEDAFAAVVMP